MQVWQFIYDKLSAGFDVILLWVLESEGSSPGRRGFKMAVVQDGSFYGTIGGGIMEYKLVEKAKASLIAQENKASLLRQFHDKQHSNGQSGMICSGNQLIASVPLANKDKPAIQKILLAENRRQMMVYLSPSGVDLCEGAAKGLFYQSELDWQYSEASDPRPVIHIIGAGHVGSALCQLMSFLGFYIHLYDNRIDNLPMPNSQRFADEIHVIDYQNTGELIPANEEDYVVIVTFGYRDDKIVFKQLLDKEFFYTGMMGSDSKIKTLLRELEEEGINPDRWKHWFTPIGIHIHSQTAQEIAVSIAAQIIKEKNKGLPTGRSEKQF